MTRPQVVAVSPPAPSPAPLPPIIWSPVHYQGALPLGATPQHGERRTRLLPPSQAARGQCPRAPTGGGRP